jgi:acyl-CoA synthetase (AMP-forming)/AMP-acid ligase II
MGDNIKCTRLQLSEANGGACPVVPRVWERLHSSAHSYPARLAVANFYQLPQLYGIDVDFERKAYLRWSYAQLSIAVDRLARSLEVLEASRGKSVATFLYNGIEFIITFWAAHKLGCHFVPLNPRTLANAKEAAHMLRVAGATIVIVQDNESAILLESLDPDTENMRTKIVVSENPPTSNWLKF